MALKITIFIQFQPNYASYLKKFKLAPIGALVIAQYFDKSIALLSISPSLSAHSKICSNPLNQSQAHRVHCGQPSNGTSSGEREREEKRERMEQGEREERGGGEEREEARRARRGENERGGTEERYR